MKFKFLRYFSLQILALAALGVRSCSADTSADIEPETAPQFQTPQHSTAVKRDGGEDSNFEAVLAQFQALNKRLEDVSFNIQSANAQLCPATERSVGMTVHTVTDYPENLQPYARALLGASDGLSIRTIRDSSPADKVGLKAGDKLVQLGGAYLPSGPTAQTLFTALSRQKYNQDEVEIKIQRGETRLARKLVPETICGYPVNLFFSERINGHTDGKEVWITSELMRSLPKDLDLALIIAHEMAHAIAGHMQFPPSKLLELEADKMALIMLARAEYDIDAAVFNWELAPHPGDAARPSATHPARGERLAHFKSALSDVQAQIRNGRVLTFSK